MFIETGCNILLLFTRKETINYKLSHVSIYNITSHNLVWACNGRRSNLLVFWLKRSPTHLSSFHAAGGGWYDVHEIYEYTREYGFFFKYCFAMKFLWNMENVNINGTFWY